MTHFLSYDLQKMHEISSKGDSPHPPITPFSPHNLHEILCLSSCKVQSPTQMSFQNIYSLCPPIKWSFFQSLPYNKMMMRIPSICLSLPSSPRHESNSHITCGKCRSSSSLALLHLCPPSSTFHPFPIHPFPYTNHPIMPKTHLESNILLIPCTANDHLISEVHFSCYKMYCTASEYSCAIAEIFNTCRI